MRLDIPQWGICILYKQKPNVKLTIGAMDVQLVSFLVSLTILLTGVSDVTGRSFQSRYGYDLKNGPVTYEAYYPEDNLLSRQALLEKSYQTAYDRDAGLMNSESADYMRPYQQRPLSYNRQYRPSIETASQRHLEDALKILIDAIRDERMAVQPAIDELQFKEPSNLPREEDKIEEETIDQRPLEYQQRQMENIFEPRPQVINYIFSRERKVNEKVNDDDQPAILQDSTQMSQAPQVASIEVSEKPHKIRHHHGEKLRRNRVAS